MYRTYDELINLESFMSRFHYLKLIGIVGVDTFGYARHINQSIYRSSRWLSVRNRVIVRDNGCNLAIPGHEIHDKIVVHHMNPLSLEDIEDGMDVVFDMRNLITTNHTTHMAIHYGDESKLPQPLVERRPGDTKLW